MADIEIVKVTLSKLGEDSGTPAEIQVKRFNSAERFARAAKMGGLFIFLAIASAFIPVLHFFLVPLFLILAGVFGVMAYSQNSELSESLVQCPYCQKETRFKKGSGILPFNDTCQHCSELIMVK